MIDCRIIRNDIRKSRLTTMITALFVALAATLVSLAVILALNLAGALDRLMVQAETPHFMQMPTILQPGPTSPITMPACIAERFLPPSRRMS